MQTQTFNSCRARIQKKLIAQRQAEKRSQSLRMAFNVSKGILFHLVVIIGLWAFVWLFYFATV